MRPGATLPLLTALLAALVARDLAVPAVHAADKRRNGNQAAPVAPAGAVAPNIGFDAFQVIIDRNIFNPNRSGRSRSAPEVKPVRTDELSLVGVVRYDGDKVAVFDGTEPAFRRGYREGETVAGFRVERINADGIRLSRNDQSLDLKVAQQLRRPEGADWKVGPSPTALADPRVLAGNGSGPARSAEAAAAEIPADASEVLKRLMQKREKQLKK
jgi:hypothetical protein